MVGEGRQYGELAKYYDLLYEQKDYEMEARTILKIIRRYKTSDGNSLLDVGCGTGKHVERLAGKFRCVGMDVSGEMLRIARDRVNGVEFVRGDMVGFDLHREFDVILCLFSSIGYARTYRRLARTLRNFAKHLRAGGVAIIEPWFTKSSYKAGHIHVLATHESDDLRVVRVDYSKVKGNLSVLDERIIVVEKERGISVFRDRMVMGLFEKAEFLRLMRGVGLEARYLRTSLAPGRGLFVGVKAPAR